jgi:hypothetical protein
LEVQTVAKAGTVRKPKAAKKADTLTVHRLRELLSYDADTGRFVWLLPTSNRVKAGQTAGSISVLGYLRINIDGRSYLAHRLAWFYTHGRWPAEQIDHINGKRADNRIANLRDCSPAQNCQNTTSRRGATSRYLGVSWAGCVKGRPWQALIKGGGKRKHLGHFATEHEASIAYRAAKPAFHDIKEGRDA